MTRLLVAHSGSLCLCHSSSFQLTLAPSDSPSSSLRRSAHKVLARLFLKLMAQEEDASEEMILQGDLKRQRNLFLTPNPDLTLPHRGVCGSFSGPHLNLYKCIPPFIISGYFHQEQKTRPSLKRPHAFWPHNGEQGTWAHADEAAAEKLNVCVSSRIIVTLEAGWQRTQAKTHVRGGDSCWRNISWCDELIQLYELFKYLLYVLCSIKDLIPKANLLILSLTQFIFFTEKHASLWS